MPIPHITQLIEIERDGKYEPFSYNDITYDVLSIVMEDPATFERWSHGHKPDLTSIFSSIAPSIKESLKKEKVRFPNFRENVTSLLNEVPTQVDRIKLYAQYKKIRELRNKCDYYDLQLINVQREGISSANEYNVFQLPGTGGTFVVNLEEAYEQLSLRHNTDIRHMPIGEMKTRCVFPFILGATEKGWGEGFSYTDCDDLFRKKGKLTSSLLLEMIHEEADSHYVGSSVDLIDTDEMQTIIDDLVEGYPHSPGEKAKLCARMEVWNQKQVVVSYDPIANAIIPLRKDISKQDIMDWINDQIDLVDEKVCFLYNEDINSFSEDQYTTFGMR